MRSQLVERLGVQEPQISHQPPDVVSHVAAEEAIELGDAYKVCDGNPLAESQKITLRIAMGERADGSWAASRVGDFGPRQGTGKNDKIAVRELAGLLVVGERLQIHTAHEFPTANESFLRMAAIFENWDDLRRKVARIRYANGEQGIELLSGQRLKYRARTGGSGRGFAKADLIVYDEAQHLQAEHVAASGPAKLANPNSQTWYAGSGGLATSALAWKMRRDALAGNAGRLAYTEKTGEKVGLVKGRIVSERPDPLDLDVWYEAMAGLGRWVTEESMLALYEELGPELFARECLCVWDAEPDTEGGVIPLDKWAACSDLDSKTQGPTAFSLDVSPDRLWSSFGVAAEGNRGGLHVELVERRPGTGWVTDYAVRLKELHKVPIAVAVGSPAWSLETDLREAKVDLVPVAVSEHAQACGALFDDIDQGRLRHVSQSELDTAVGGADKRDYGDAWLWSRKKSSVDISPLVAVTLARWAHLNRPRASKPRAAWV